MTDKLKILSILVLSVIALMAVMYIPVMANEDAANGRLVALKMRGAAIYRGDERRIRSNVYLHVWMSAERVDRTIRFYIQNGSICIDGIEYMFIEGRGIAGRFHCRCHGRIIAGMILIRGKAISEEGETLNFTMLGRVILWRGRTRAYIVAIGLLKGESQRYSLLLEGLIVPVRVRAA